MGQIVDPITLEKGLKTTFFKAYESAKPDWEKFVTRVDSGSDQEKYGWLGSAPIMREWTDERVPKGLIDHDYTIKNKHFEASIGVDRDDLQDDKYGQIKVRIADMGKRAKIYPRKYMFDIMVAGLTGLCYDGQYYYDTDHSEGESGAQSNKLTGTGTTESQVTTDFIAARSAMRRFKDDRSEIFHQDELKLIVVAPVEMESTFEKLLNSSLISNSDNPMKGAAELLTYPFADVNDWYVFNIGSYIKPFIFQDRQPVQFGALEGKSDNGFMRKHFVYGADSRFNIGYGLWQNAIIITNA